MEGWIKIHRKILDNPIICKDSDYLSVWIYLLLNATHKEIPALFKGKKIMLQKGQLITGRKSISNQLKISESKIYRIINDFKSEQQIEQQTSNQNSLITILNWDKYQQLEQQNEQQMNNERTTDEQRVNTNNNVKNDKNVKNGRNNNKPAEPKIHFAEFVSMTNAEYEKLVSTHGKEFADQCIKELDNYKGANGKKYQSDYRAILSWVVDKVNKQKPKQKTSDNSDWERWLKEHE